MAVKLELIINFKNNQQVKFSYYDDVVTYSGCEEIKTEVNGYRDSTEVYEKSRKICSGKDLLVFIISLYHPGYGYFYNADDWDEKRWERTMDFFHFENNRNIIEGITDFSQIKNIMLDETILFTDIDPDEVEDGIIIANRGYVFNYFTNDYISRDNSHIKKHIKPWTDRKVINQFEIKKINQEYQVLRISTDNNVFILSLKDDSNIEGYYSGVMNLVRGFPVLYPGDGWYRDDKKIESVSEFMAVLYSWQMDLDYDEIGDVFAFFTNNLSADDYLKIFEASYMRTLLPKNYMKNLKKMNYTEQVNSIANAYISEYELHNFREDISPFLTAINQIESVDDIIRLDYGIGNYETTSPVAEELDNYIFKV